MLIRSLAISILCALAASPAMAINNTFTYQGSMTDAGQPANGTFDFEFQVYRRDTGAAVGDPMRADDLSVSQGVFTAPLTMTTPFSSQDYELEIRVRPGSATGAYTTLAPRTRLQASPQAQISNVALIADSALSVADDSITSAKIAAGAVTSVDVAAGAIGSTQINTSQVQQRVAGTCASGSSIRSVAADGTVTCETDDSGAGTVTSVDAGTGLTGGPITSSGTLAIANGGVGSLQLANGAVTNDHIAQGAVSAFSINPVEVQRRVTGICSPGFSIREIQLNGDVLCEPDSTGGNGTVTSISTGTGLTGGPISSTGTISIAAGGVGNAQIATGAVTAASIDSSQVQRRVSGTCVAGSSIRNIDAAGGVVCETDDTGVAAWALAGNAGTNPATQFIGTTDAQDLNVRVNNSVAMRIELPVSGSAGLVNIVAGHPNNSVVDNSGMQTISGGGRGTNTCGRSTVDSCSHSATGQAATIAGGEGNVAATYGVVAGGGSNTAGNSAAVSGGSRNIASGVLSAIAGGTFNTASGTHATVAGGDTNCAGGNYSFAAGKLARVRHGNEATDVPCSAIAPSSGDTDGDEGTFIWADATATEIASTGPNQFIVRASGGLYFGNNSTVSIPAGRFINTSTGAHLTTGGTWTNSSSRTLKHGFVAVDPLAVLAQVNALPISRWQYNGSTEGTHMGPVAEDFHAAFGLGNTDRAISTVDADGVALAAIQGLNQKLEQRLAEQEQENAALRADLESLRAIVNALRADTH